MTDSQLKKIFYAIACLWMTAFLMLALIYKLTSRVETVLTNYEQELHCEGYYEKLQP